jgi:UMF1 family MFS transporter
VRERGNPNPGRVFDLRVIAQSGRTTLKTLREGKQYPGLMRFLVGRVFYTDSINTVIAMMFLFATAIFGAAGQDGVTADQSAYRVMFVAIAFAVVGGFIWGRVVDRIGPKRTLDIVLYLWMATFSLASLVSLLGLSPSLLYVVGTMAGIGLGGIWSADRPLMLRLTPPDRIGEFYGLYGMVGRFSAIVGPAMWAEVIHLATGKMNQSILTAQGIAIALLLVMILVSWRILRPLDDSRRAWKPTR